MASHPIRKLEPRSPYYTHVVWSALLNGEIGVTATEDDFDLELKLGYAQKFADSLNSLTKQCQLDFFDAAKRYYDDTFDRFAIPAIDMSTHAGIRSAITFPTYLLIPANASNRTVVYLESECKWHPELGLQALIRDGKLLYLGPGGGIDDPFAEFINGQEWWNYTN